jgi:hypothetical protein
VEGMTLLLLLVPWETRLCVCSCCNQNHVPSVTLYYLSFVLFFCSVLLCSVLVCCNRSISSAPVFPVLHSSSLQPCAPVLSHHILS